MLELDERFWRDRITLEGSGNDHIDLTKKNIYIRNTKGNNRGASTIIFTDSEHSDLTKDMKQVTAVRHSVETEAWVYCVNTINSRVDATQKVLCHKFSH